MRGIKLILAIAVLATAGWFALSGQWPWRRFDVPAKPVPALMAEADAAPEAPPVERWREVADTLRRGETLSALFRRQGVRGLEPGLLRRELDPRRLRPGLVFSFRREAEDSAPTHIVVRTDAETRLRFVRDGGEWSTERDTIVWTPEIVRLSGDVGTSLYEALDSDVPDSLLAGPERMRLAWDIADIYAWQVDFTKDLQPGDHFQLLVERLRSEEGEVRFGRVIASDLSVGGRALTAFRFGRDGGRGAFYDAKGVSLKQAWLRAPVEFRRISSNFTRSRFHPVLGVRRRHEGTDYAASPGTPIMAASDGVVLRIGRAGGYGNLVELRHRGGITTRYGHMRGFARGLRKGAAVRQGQVIGYVGSTGLASGPHLHYEFRVNGVAKDSRTVKLPGGVPLEGKQRAAFQAERERLAARLYGESEPATPDAPPIPPQADLVASRASRSS